jgi:hypothetical protein
MALDDDTRERAHDAEPDTGYPPPRPDMSPGDEAPPGEPQGGENLCRECGGSGRVDGGTCATCGGSGKTTSAISAGP